MFIYSTIVSRCPAMLMSETGQKRRFDRASIISGLPRKADIFSVRRHVSKVPQPYARQALAIPSSVSETWGGSSFLQSWHRRNLAEDVRLRCLSENAPTWFWCRIDAGRPLQAVSHEQPLLSRGGSGV